MSSYLSLCVLILYRVMMYNVAFLDCNCLQAMHLNVTAISSCQFWLRKVLTIMVVIFVVCLHFSSWLLLRVPSSISSPPYWRDSHTRYHWVWEFSDVYRCWCVRDPNPNVVCCGYHRFLLLTVCCGQNYQSHLNAGCYWVILFSTLTALFSI